MGNNIGTTSGDVDVYWNSGRNTLEKFIEETMANTPTNRKRGCCLNMVDPNISRTGFNGLKIPIFNLNYKDKSTNPNEQHTLTKKIFYPYNPDTFCVITEGVTVKKDNRYGGPPTRLFQDQGKAEFAEVARCDTFYNEFCGAHIGNIKCTEAVPGKFFHNISTKPHCTPQNMFEFHDDCRCVNSKMGQFYTGIDANELPDNLKQYHSPLFYATEQERVPFGNDARCTSFVDPKKSATKAYLDDKARVDRKVVLCKNEINMINSEFAGGTELNEIKQSNNCGVSPPPPPAPRATPPAAVETVPEPKPELNVDTTVAPTTTPSGSTGGAASSTTTTPPATPPATSGVTTGTGKTIATTGDTPASAPASVTTSTPAASTSTPSQTTSPTTTPAAKTTPAPSVTDKVEDTMEETNSLGLTTTQMIGIGVGIVAIILIAVFVIFKRRSSARAMQEQMQMAQMAAGFGGFGGFGGVGV